MKKFFLTILSLIYVIFSFSQTNVKINKQEFLIYKKGKREAWKNIRYGDYLFKQNTKGSYMLALDYYLKAYSYNPDNLALNYKIGICYLKTLFKYKALPYLEKVIEQNPNLTEDLYFYYAYALQQNYQFEKAIEYYQKFMKTALYQTNDYYQYFTNKHIIECRNGMKLLQDTLPIALINLEVLNSKYDDYGPVITADGSKLYFTSRRPNPFNIKDQQGQYFDDIYYSEKKDNHWTEPKNVGTPLNTLSHDAVVGLSSDGQTMILYKNGDLYWSKKEGNSWSEPKPFPKVINSKQIESSAALSPDGNVLYFVRGKSLDPLKSNGDIYYSIRDTNGKWSEPIRLPDNVNTPYDEDGLYLHPDGKTLYFSSKGHNSMGGYDVFKTVRQPDGTWSDPVNLGFPLNTPDDDIYFVLSANAQVGYISAARQDSKGFTDIYAVHLFTADPFTAGESQLLAGLAKPSVEVSFEPPVKLAIIKGKIVDTAGNPIEATIEIIDNETGKVVMRFKTNATTGEYLVTLPPGRNYAMVVYKEGYLFHTENFDLEDVTGYKEVEKQLVLEQIAPETKTELSNIFFDYNSAKLRPQSYYELDRVVEFLKQHPNLKVEISGHTDTLGSFEYNMWLSEQRAKAVVNYLVKKGISPDRLIPKGYGPTKPIASNKTPEGRAKNRRVEFKILETGREQE